MSRRVSRVRSSFSSWLMASGMARSHRGLAGTLDPGQPVALVWVGTISSAHVFRHVSRRFYRMQDPGPFLRGSHKGSYGTLAGRAQGLADLGGPRRADGRRDGRPPPGLGTIRLCRLRCRRAARAPGFCNEPYMRRRRHLPRASGGASAAPSRAALFPAARIMGTSPTPSGRPAPAGPGPAPSRPPRCGSTSKWARSRSTLGFDALHLLGGGSRFTTSSEIVGRCIAECGRWMRVYEHAGVPKCDTCGCVDEF